MLWVKTKAPFWGDNYFPTVFSNAAFRMFTRLLGYPCDASHPLAPFFEAPSFVVRTEARSHIRPNLLRLSAFDTGISLEVALVVFYGPSCLQKRGLRVGIGLALKIFLFSIFDCTLYSWFLRCNLLESHRHFSGASTIWGHCRIPRHPNNLRCLRAMKVVLMIAGTRKPIDRSFKGKKGRVPHIESIVRNQTVLVAGESKRNPKWNDTWKETTWKTYCVGVMLHPAHVTNPSILPCLSIVNQKILWLSTQVCLQTLKTSKLCEQTPPHQQLDYPIFRICWPASNWNSLCWPASNWNRPWGQVVQKTEDPNKLPTWCHITKFRPPKKSI